MALVGDDCYFFCTSTCSKGANCPFRHVEAAKTCRIICQHWQMGGCLRPSCKFRHSDFHIQINPTEIACYWETQPSGCKKSNCLFKHSKPRPEQQEDSTKAATNLSSQSENTSAENVTNGSTLKFIRPVVEPVVIEPDSEASNSSPVKSLEKRKTDDPKENPTAGDKEGGKGVLKEENTSSDSVEKKKTAKPKKTQKSPQKGNVKKNMEKSPQKKKVAGTKKGTIQKKQEKSSPKEVKRRKAPPVKAGVKERLGTVRKEPEQPIQEESSGSESTDSDDSIENVKVLSMEEIFRQKALESMMKKRAAAGKPMLPPSVSAVKKPASKPPTKNITRSPKKEPPKPKKEQLKQVVEEEEEEEEEESDAEEEDEDSEAEEEEDDKEEECEDEETEDEEEDSSESSSYESSESEEEIEAPRRVIIDIDDNEKLARRRKVNKNNLQKRPLMKSDVKARKREVIREPALKEEPPLKKSKNVTIKRPPDIRRRLGKPVSESSDYDSEERGKKFATKRRLVVEEEKVPEDPERAEEDTVRGVIKVKTLEEIRAEKARRLEDNNQLSPQRERRGSGIQPLKRTIMLQDDVKDSALSDPGPVGIVENKKAKKRPWKRQKTAPPRQEEEDHRTVSAAAPPKSADDSFQIELEQYKASQEKEETSPESPMESLRRRALLKKVLSQGIMQESEEVLKKSHSKKSKHKHKHKKKSKIERQLYVPPALKSSGVKSLPSDEEKPALSDEDKPQDSTGASGDAFEKTAPQRAVAQRVGALWAAGLSAPSKGLGLRNVPKKELVKEIKEAKPLLQKAEAMPPSKKEPSDDSLPTIKTFSQIMAEKREKRLLLQQQAKKADASPEGIPSSKKSDPNPRVPISPIVFNPGSKHLTKSSAPLKTTVNPLREENPSPSKLSGPVKQDFFALRPEKSKKLFKKPVSKEVALDLDLESPSLTEHSQSLETSLKEETDLKSAVPASPSIPPLLSSEKEPVSSSEKTQKRRSIEDEFSFFGDGDDLDEVAIHDDVEPIDDLLQDIDSLLA